MKTRQYKRNTKNKRNKKTRRRGGATQSSIMTRFMDIFSPGKPEPKLTMMQSFNKLGEAGAELVASGAESSASIVRGAAEVTRKIGVSIELASYLSGKSSVRLVSTVNLGTNITFGAISLLGEATALFFTCTKKLLRTLNNVLRANDIALAIIENDCIAAKITKDMHVGSIDIPVCMGRYEKYLDNYVKNTTRLIESIFDTMKAGLNIKRSQVKKYMLYVGCTKPRTWRIIGAKRYNCNNISSVLVQVDSNGKYKYLPDGTNEKGVKVIRITLVDEYTRLKGLQNTLSDLKTFTVKKFNDEAARIKSDITHVENLDPLSYIHRVIFDFNSIKHSKRIYEELTLELDTPFSIFCDLLQQIYEYKKQIQPNRNTTEAEEIIAEGEINKLMDDKVEEAKNYENDKLNSDINQLLEQDELETLKSEGPATLIDFENNASEVPESLGEYGNNHLRNMYISNQNRQRSTPNKLGGTSRLNTTYKTIKHLSQSVGNTVDKKIFRPLERYMGINPELELDPTLRKSIEESMAAARALHSGTKSNLELNKRKNAYLNSINNPSPSNQVQSIPKIQGNENEHLSAMYKNMKGDFLNKNSKNKNSKKKNSKNEIIAETSNPMLSNMNNRESYVQPSPQPSPQKTGYSPSMFSSIDLSIFNPMSSF